MRTGGMMNAGDGQRSWLDNFVSRLAVPAQQQRIAGGQRSIAKYADFVCTACSRVYTKEAAVNQLQGVCPCGCEVTAVNEIQTKEAAQAERPMECIGCGEVYPRTALKQGSTCECGGTKFVSQNLMDQVCANTESVLAKHGMQVEQIGHERGVIFVQVAGRAGNKAVFRAQAQATGKFTENDVIMFQWDEEGGVADVITAQNDKLVKFAKNKNCKVAFEFEDSYRAPKDVVLADARGRKIGVGSKLCWYTPHGPVRGQVTSADQDGNLIVGITQSRDGKAKRGFLEEVAVSQRAIQQLGIEAE